MQRIVIPKYGADPDEQTLSFIVVEQITGRSFGQSHGFSSSPKFVAIGLSEVPKLHLVTSFSGKFNREQPIAAQLGA